MKEITLLQQMVKQTREDFQLVQGFGGMDSIRKGSQADRHLAPQSTRSEPAGVNWAKADPTLPGFTPRNSLGRKMTFPDSNPTHQDRSQTERFLRPLKLATRNQKASGNPSLEASLGALDQIEEQTLNFATRLQTSTRNLDGGSNPGYQVPTEQSLREFDGYDEKKLNERRDSRSNEIKQKPFSDSTD